jgi:hypothetical protein
MIHDAVAKPLGNNSKDLARKFDNFMIEGKTILQDLSYVFLEGMKSILNDTREIDA